MRLMTKNKTACVCLLPLLQPILVNAATRGYSQRCAGSLWPALVHAGQLLRACRPAEQSAVKLRHHWWLAGATTDVLAACGLLWSMLASCCMLAGLSSP